MKHYYPTALVRFHVRLNNVGQENPDDLLLLQFPVVDLRVHVNHFNEADKIHVRVDYEDFPIDPRILRGATIEAFIANSEAGIDPHFWEKQSPEDMHEKWAVFAGVADEIETSLDSDEGRSFEVRGRDYTALFIDAQMESEPIAFTEGGRRLTIVEVLEKIIAQRITTQALELVVDESLTEIPVPAEYKAGGTDTNLGKRHKKRAESVWDAMVELAAEAGLIIYVSLDQVVIRQPHTLFLSEGMDTERFYRFTAGENLKTLKPSRLLGRQQGINVRCISYDPRTKVRLVANAPQRPEDAESKEISAAPVMDDGERQAVDQKRLKVRPYVFRGITDLGQLQRIADEIYQLVRYHDTEAEFSTDDMEDSTGKSVLGLRFGDPVVFEALEQFRSIMAFSPQEQRDRLVAIGYPREAAEAIAAALDNMTVPFYVAELRHSFNADRGYSLDVSVRARKQVEIGESTPGEAIQQIEGS